MKSLYDLSEKITEEQYRSDPALSYSTLAKYERGGFNSIPTLMDKISTTSLLLGSCVDTVITGSWDDFYKQYVVANIPATTDTIIQIVTKIFSNLKTPCASLDLVKSDDILAAVNEFNYSPNWRPETRVKVIREKGEDYFKFLYIAGNKTIISMDMYNDVVRMVDALQTSEATKWYFQADDCFDGIQRFFQLKFKATLNGVDYRCMFDELIVDTKNKRIFPVDLKTSHKKEHDFYKSFVEWNYQIQNRLYARILKDVISKDEYFKDYTIMDYVDIVVCKDSLNPLVWKCPFTFTKGTLVFGKNKQIEMRDPEEIGQELFHYLTTNAKVPKGIENVNDLTEWLDKY